MLLKSHIPPRETRSWYSAVQSVYNSVVALKRLMICSSRFLLAERYPMMRRTVASTCICVDPPSVETQ